MSRADVALRPLRVVMRQKGLVEGLGLPSTFQQFAALARERPGPLSAADLLHPVSRANLVAVLLNAPAEPSVRSPKPLPFAGLIQAPPLQ